jgi:hypothetical protein
MAEPMAAELRTENGVAEIFLDGKLYGRGLGRLADPGFEAVNKLEQYGPAGIQLFITSLFEPNIFCWDGRDGYDYETYDSHLKALVEAKPDIRLILYLGGRAGTPYLWCRDNEEELILLHNGVRLRLGSFASEKWRRDSTEAIRRFVEHMENGPYARNIAGYNPVLIDNEWRLSLDKVGWGDFSRPMREGFRAWLRTKYQNDEARLREAWRDRDASFDTAEAPDVAMREHAQSAGMFGHVERYGARIADFYECHNELAADFALGYCRTVKQTVRAPKLVGLMFGYAYCNMNSMPHPQQSANLAATRLFRSPDVDYFHSPYHYYNRCIGGVHYSQHAVDSVLMRGKMMFGQIDTKTHLHPRNNTNAKTPWEDEQILKRDVSYTLTKGAHHYWYEMANVTFAAQNRSGTFRDYTYNTPEIRAHIAVLERLADEGRRSEPVAEVALFNSQRGDFYRQFEKAYGNFYSEALRQYQLPYVGMPFDDYILEDLPDVKRKYRVYLFPNAGYVPRDLREAIRAKLEADGATALWFYAPGYVTDDGACALENITKLTGLRMGRTDDKPDFVQVELTDRQHPLTRGLEVSDFGTDIDPMYFQSKQEWAQWFSLNRDDYKLTPRFFVDDPEATVLGSLRGTGKAGLAIKRVGDSTSIYCSAPVPPVELLARIFEQAGVHRYSRHHDLVYANRRYVCVCASTAGAHTIRLPRACDVYDAFSGHKLAGNTRELVKETQALETVVLRLEDPK